MPFQKGHTVNKGRKFPISFGKKISKARRGMVFTKEHIANLSKSHFGYKPTEETKKKMSEAQKGKKRSAKIKKAMSQRMMGQVWSEESREKARKAKLGKKQSKELIEKRFKNLRGEKHWNWRGGITPENIKIRNSIELRLWREAVFARDNWTCQKCWARNGMGKSITLHPHHIQGFAQFLELRTSIENGISFCKDCHWEFHKKYGTKNNNSEQIKEFLDKSYEQ